MSGKAKAWDALGDEHGRPGRSSLEAWGRAQTELTRPAHVLLIALCRGSAPGAGEAFTPCTCRSPGGAEGVARLLSSEAALGR